MKITSLQQSMVELARSIVYSVVGIDNVAKGKLLLARSDSFEVLRRNEDERVRDVRV